VQAGVKYIPCAEDKYCDENNKVKLTWEDFNANYDSICPPYAEIQEICKYYPEKMIDLNPYMWKRPYRINEKDTIETVNELFRHMNLRSLPVISEKDFTLVGIITRQDLFAFMSI
jgi:hypothetical protein